MFRDKLVYKAFNKLILPAGSVNLSTISLRSFIAHVKGHIGQPLTVMAHLVSLILCFSNFLDMDTGLPTKYETWRNLFSLLFFEKIIIQDIIKIST